MNNAFARRAEKSKRYNASVDVHKPLGAPDYLAEVQKPARIFARVRPDPVYLVLFVILLTVGTVMSFSAGSAYAERQYGDSFHFLKEHLLHMAFGAVAMVLIMMIITPTTMRYMSIAMYLAVIILLLLVLVKGVTGGGAQRWISVFGIFNFQPSEAAKTALVLLLSLYMSRWEQEINSKGLNKSSFIHGFLVPGLLIGTILVLVGLEKHFSGVIILGFIGVVMMYFGGTNLLWFLSVLPIGGVLGVIIMNTDYARRRIDSWQNRGADALGSDWQSTQGLYAIGTGGLFGVGLGQSRLKYGYVSQPQNDFVFTIVCEELGFFGAAAIMLLFLALIARGFVLAARASDKFCSLVIFGLSFKLALQVIFNIGVVSGWLPNTGIALPYFSTGGTATIMQMLEAGIVLGLSQFCSQKRS